MKLKNYSKYLSPIRYWNRAVCFLNKTVLHFLDIYTAPDYNKEFKYPPIFFLGAPRSGSTLIYQVVTEAFDVSYMSNRHCQFFGAPALAERIFNPIKNKAPSAYTSKHGETEGWSAPSECGAWWYRFFRRFPAYVTLTDIDEKKMINFRRSLLALTEATNKPVLFKNLYASLRLKVIVKHIPEALFIVINRDELDNGHSLLEGRFKVSGDYNEWWSMPPPNINEIKTLQPHEQVIEQIRGIYQTIDADLESVGVPSEKIHVINYETFCGDVNNELTKLHNFFKMNHCDIELDTSKTPKTFKRRNTIRIDQGMYKKMMEYANKKV